MNSKKVFIIHGFGGLPNGGWFPWLMAELAKHRIFACAIPMPNPKNPIVTEWVETIHKYIGNETDDVILIGHSLGATGVLRYLESLPKDKLFGGVVLVSGVVESLDLGNPKSNFRRIDSFVDSPIDFQKIKSTSNNFAVIHGEKDIIVPIAQSEKVSNEIGSELVRVGDGDHFSQLTEPICYELPEALEEILKMINK